MPLPGSSHPLAQPQFDQRPDRWQHPDAGPQHSVSALRGTAGRSQSVARRSAEPELAAQYHQWLTPAQFGSRFGLSDADLAKVQSWLESEGFVRSRSISRARNRISFSGTVSQVEVRIPHRTSQLQDRATKSTWRMRHEISIPASLSGVVLGVQHLSNFRLKPHYRRPSRNLPPGCPATNFVSPGDITTIYDLGPLYTAELRWHGSKDRHRRSERDQ